MPERLRAPRWTHIALPVSDLDRSIEFYTALTPLVVVHRHEDANGRSAWLSNDHQVVDPFVLVLDDYHLIADAQIHAGMIYLIEHLPPNVHAIVVTPTG